MIKRFRVAWMATAFVLISAAPASAQVGHRVESLVVPGSAQSEQRKVPVHLWYPADAAAFATASPTVYTSALHGKPLPAQWDPLAWKIDARLARETSAVAASSAPYPVLVFSHGSVNDPIDYAFTLEQIARAGFVVAAPGHTNNTQDDVRIDYINTQAGQTLFPCNDGRPSPCSRTDNPRSMQDRVRDVSAILDAMPGWFGSRVDVAKAGVIGHSRGTVTALASAGGARSGEYGPDRRVQAIMGMAIGLRPLRDLADLSKITVPTLLVAGGLDRNSEQAISEEAIAAIPSADKRFVAIPNATHRSFDSTYCSQLQSAAAIAQSNPRAILDAYSVPLIAASAPGLVSGKAVHYCTASTFTTPVDIRQLIAATPNAEFPPAVGGTSVCSSTAIPCTGLDTDQVSDQMSALAIDFFTAKLARAVGAPVSGTVPPTLSLTLGDPASFGVFMPGVAREYTASTTANVTSSAADATLAVADPSATGRLANGPITLPQPLQVSAGGPFTTVPATLRAWSAPTSNEVVTLQFRQAIGANDALRTGTYSTTLTFTLSTTNP